jgi:hypothetical protein
VYTELLEFKSQMLANASRKLESMSAAARKETEQTDLVIMATEKDRFRRRLDYWERRRRELSGR